MRNQSPFKKKFVFRNDTGEREERVLCFDWRGNPISLQTYQVIKERAEARVIVPSDQVQIAYIDGYAGKNTLTNLKELAQIAILNPAKLFVVAGGNPSIGLDYKIPDIRTARAVLEKAGSWPDNIIVVGAREGTRSANKLLSLGADIYVDGEDLRRFGFETCSSFSVPVITEIVYQLTKKGIQNPSEINYFLVLFSDLRRSDNNVYYRLLNLEKARQFLGTV